MRTLSTVQLLVLVVAALAAIGPKSCAGSPDTASWLSKVQHLSLQQLTLPGTHDSCSYNLTTELIGVPPFIDEIVQVADSLNVSIGSVIDGWAQSQTLSLYDQFQSGIRYADIRACFVNGEWHTNHGVVLGGATLAHVLGDAADFLMEQPTEILVLEISHTESYSQPSSDAVDTLVELITSLFGTLLMPANSTLLSVPLSELVEANRRVLVSVDDPMAPAQSDLIWPGDTIYNTYANSPVLADMQAYNVQQVLNFTAAQPTQDNLYKLSWTLTANAGTILGMLVPGQPRTLLELVAIANPTLGPWVTALRAQYPALAIPFLGNVLIIDWEQTSDIVEICARGKSG